MKRKISVFMCLTLIVSLLFAIVGCSSNGNEEGQKTPVTIGTSEGAGTYGIVGGAFTSVLNQYSETITASVHGTSGGGNANARLLQAHELDFGLTTLMAGYDSWNKQAAFANDPEPLQNLRSVLVGASSLIHVVVHADSPYTKIEDLKGKKIAAVSASSHEVAIPTLFNAYGISKDEYEGVQFGTAEAIDQFKDRHVDAIASGVMGPAAAIQDLALTHDVRFLPIDNEIIDSILESVPHFQRGIIKAEWYEGLGEDIPTLNMPILFASHDEVQEDLVYEVVKTLLENSDELNAIHPTAGEYSPETQKKFVSDGGQVIPPLHPGAERYFKEQGWIK